MITRRGLVQAGAAGVLVLGGGARGWAQAADRYADVDPEMVADLRLISEMEVSGATLAAFRHRPAAPHAQPAPPAAAAAPLAERMLPGLPGQPPVRVLLFDGGAGRRGRGAVVWMHGGGYVAGAAGVPSDLREAARAHGWLVVSVDYRLAPEAGYIQSVSDTYAALRWVDAQADALGVDRARIGVGGASAGGGHAAMLALAARDRGEVALAAQVLIYPMLDDRTGSTRAPRPGTGAHVWTARSNRFGWTALLGQQAGSASVPAEAVPARRRDLAGLPPAFVGVGTLDLFLDEDLAYAAALTAAGGRVDLAVVPAAFHAFDGVAPQARASRAFTQRWLGHLAATIG